MTIKINKKEIVSRNPFASYIGMELLEVGEGFSRARIKVKEQHGNIYGGVHGGCAFALADTAAGVAAASSGCKVTTLNASMNYMLAAQNTEFLYCEASVVRRGNRISVVRTELKNDAGDLLMDGSFTFYHKK